MRSTLAIMQPYLMPYIGYFQLLNCVDTFVVYDDVQFTRRGWINRNRILSKHESSSFTIPVRKSSRQSLINEISLSSDNYLRWKDTFLKTVRNIYSSAPYYNFTYEFLVRTFDAKHTMLADLLKCTLREVKDYLGIKTRLILTSEAYNNRNMIGQERIIDICKKESASSYINASGGIDLYQKDDFQTAGIKLQFISQRPISYAQFANDFIPNLSIIDVMMFNSAETIRGYLDEYDLV